VSTTTSDTNEDKKLKLKYERQTEKQAGIQESKSMGSKERIGKTCYRDSTAVNDRRRKAQDGQSTKAPSNTAQKCPRKYSEDIALEIVQGRRSEDIALEIVQGVEAVQQKLQSGRSE